MRLLTVTGPGGIGKTRARARARAAPGRRASRAARASCRWRRSTRPRGSCPRSRRRSAWSRARAGSAFDAPRRAPGRAAPSCSCSTTSSRCSTPRPDARRPAGRVAPGQARRDEPRPAARRGRAGARDLAAGARAGRRAVRQPRPRAEPAPGPSARRPGARSSASASSSTGSRSRSSSRPRARKVLSPAAILERLQHRLDLLSAGPRDAPARQQTLRAAIGWSYDLLDPDVRVLFAQLGVFVGGWTLEAAEAVCGAAALDGLSTLMDQSLADRGRRTASRCSRPCASTPSSASPRTAPRRRCAAATRGRTPSSRRAPTRACAAATVGAWLDRLHADRENLRAAIGFAAADGDAARPRWRCAAAGATGPTRGNVAEGRALTALALASGDGPPELRVRALNCAGRAGERAGRLRRGPGAFEETLELAQRTGAAGGVGGRLGQPRQPGAVRGRLRRGDPPLRARARLLARRSRTCAGSA